MNWFFIQFFGFISNMFNGNSDVSSKRVNGTLCVLTVLALLIISSIFKLEISDELLTLTKMVFWGGVSLLGLGIIDKKRNDKIL